MLQTHTHRRHAVVSSSIIILKRTKGETAPARGALARTSAYPMDLLWHRKTGGGGRSPKGTDARGAMPAVTPKMSGAAPISDDIQSIESQSEVASTGPHSERHAPAARNAVAGAQATASCSTRRHSRGIHDARPCPLRASPCM
jgi:hypothetical protein